MLTPSSWLSWSSPLLRARLSVVRARSVVARACAVLASVASIALPGAITSRASAQADLYDPTVLRNLAFQFHDANWWTLLQQNYQSQTNILADLTVDGVTYPNVGVRIRGNTSYTALPAGSQKVSLNVEMDFVDANQTLLGYNALNLNNGFHDATFCREVVYNNFVAQYMPNPRANHVTVSLNGANWGVYINVQQYNKDLLRDWFADEDGLRIKCANNPNGPGLTYNGGLPSGYTGYEIKSDGGLADPWAPLIMVCGKITNEPLVSWQNIDAVFAIDPSIWSVVFENLLTDDDSYVNKGADFMLYRDPADGRMHLHQTDANETFTQAGWSVTRNFTAANKPFLSRVIDDVPELRQRYMAHYRAMLPHLNWAELEPIFMAHKNLIAAAVAADPKKLYSVTLFNNNFTTTVNLPYPGLAGGTVIGLQQFVTQRAASLNANAELAAQGPVISAVNASAEFPAPDEDVWITAAVAPAPGGSVAEVELFYLPAPGSYSRVFMLDDGASGDGAAGDGVYGALLPVTASAGQKVRYYVMAKAGNAFGSLTFSPMLSENGPLTVAYGFGGSGIRITEWMYQGASGEFFELTNFSASPIDLTGWSMDDDSATPGVFSLSGAGIVAPGESIVVTDATPATFKTAWGLTTTKVLGPNTVAALGRNDQINIYDATGSLVERLTYGDETFPGTIRTQNKSGQTCVQSVGIDDVHAWVLAVNGDVYGSHVATTAELGAPGAFISVSCTPGCAADLDGNGSVGGEDVTIVLGAWGGAGVGDANGDGVIDGADLTAILGAWGGCP